MIWGNDLIDPSGERLTKPRAHGITMVIDKGLGKSEFRDLLEIGSEYIDFVKLGFGTAGITPFSVLEAKLTLARENQVTLYPGGTFFEVAFVQNRWKEYFQTLWQIGFRWVEISDGTISLSDEARTEAIQYARSLGFQVITEIGKKTAGAVTPIEQFCAQFHLDTSAGASYVILEGRESGENIGMFNAQGKIRHSYFQEIVSHIPIEQIIWEAPQKNQQTELILQLGTNVNIGNVPPNDVLALEALRRGLRSDTFDLWRSHP
jgi:phosphosulfolactate synthase